MGKARLKAPPGELVNKYADAYREFLAAEARGDKQRSQTLARMLESMRKSYGLLVANAAVARCHSFGRSRAS